MGCRLDFLAYKYASDVPDVRPDGFLTSEFAEMEKFAQDGATSNTVNDYWCDLATRPELYCLDIGASSTLSESLNDTAFNLLEDNVFSNGHFIREIYAGADNTSVNLFGQVDRCGASNKVVGDGLINVFDIATLMAYVFKDYQYAALDPNPDQVPTVEGRVRLIEQCSTEMTRVDFLTDYAENSCLYFEDEGRRLQEGELHASEIAARWRSNMITAVPRASPLHRKEWKPLLTRAAGPVEQFKLGVAHHTFVPDVDHATGRWYTLRMGAVPLRLHAVFHGMPTQTMTTLQYEAYDGSPPIDHTQRVVRYTRYCEYGNTCDRSCSIITTGHSANKAMYQSTLELKQDEIARACPYDVHIWVPFSSTDTDRCVGVDYITIADGVRGQFARDTQCTRHVTYASPPPPPTPMVSTPASPSLPALPLPPAPAPPGGAYVENVNITRALAIFDSNLQLMSQAATTLDALTAFELQIIATTIQETMISSVAMILTNLIAHISSTLCQNPIHVGIEVISTLLVQNMSHNLDVVAQNVTSVQDQGEVKCAATRRRLTDGLTHRRPRRQLSPCDGDNVTFVIRYDVRVRFAPQDSLKTLIEEIERTLRTLSMTNGSTSSDVCPEPAYQSATQSPMLFLPAAASPTLPPPTRTRTRVPMLAIAAIFMLLSGCACVCCVCAILARRRRCNRVGAAAPRMRACGVCTTMNHPMSRDRDNLRV